MSDTVKPPHTGASSDSTVRDHGESSDSDTTGHLEQTDAKLLSRDEDKEVNSGDGSEQSADEQGKDHLENNTETESAEQTPVAEAEVHNSDAEEEVADEIAEEKSPTEAAAAVTVVEEAATENTVLVGAADDEISAKDAAVEQVAIDDVATDDTHAEDAAAEAETADDSLASSHDTSSDHIEGATGGGSDESDADDAPPLPDKIPLPASTENLSMAAAGGSGTSDSNTLQGPLQAYTQQSSQQNLYQGVEIPVITFHPEESVMPASLAPGATPGPNEPPPPYPGGPAPSANRDPYSGIPGDDRVASETTVLVARPAATGNCPKCQIGYRMKTFSFLGICLAIWCFPCGLICLFCMRNKKCSHCGANLK